NHHHHRLVPENYDHPVPELVPTHLHRQRGPPPAVLLQPRPREELVKMSCWGPSPISKMKKILLSELLEEMKKKIIYLWPRDTWQCLLLRVRGSRSRRQSPEQLSVSRA